MAATRRMSGGRRKGTRKNNAMEGGKRRSRRNNAMEGGKRRSRRNNTMEGGKRKASPWNNLVKKVFKEMRSKDKDASFGDALKAASKLKKDM